MVWKLIFISFGLQLVCSQYELPEPDFELLSPLGFRASIPDSSEVEIFAFHASINEPLYGVEGGQINQDIRGPIGKWWIYQDNTLKLKEGDVIYYWYYVRADGIGYQKTNQSWVVTSDNSTTSNITDYLNQIALSPTVSISLSTSTSTSTGSISKPPISVAIPSSSASKPPGSVAKPPSSAVVSPTGSPDQSEYGTSVPTGCKKSATTVNGQSACKGQLILEENFDVFNLDRWQHEITLAGGGNWEFQLYHNNRSNSYVRDGVLVIRPTLTSDKYGEAFLSSGELDFKGGTPADHCTDATFHGCKRKGTPTNIINPIQSASIRTVNSFNFRYGKVEVRAKMPAGDWIWPAIWLKPKNNAYGSWPASGEIDIAELRGNRNLVNKGVNIGVEQIGSSLHFGPYHPLDGFTKASKLLNTESGNGYHKSFHTYTMEWTPDYIRFAVDDTEVNKVTPPDGGFWEFGDFSKEAPEAENPWRYGTKMAPFDQEFYIVLNVAVGGVNYFPDEAENPAPKPWSNFSPKAPMEFWVGKNHWYKTWNPHKNNGEDAAMQVDYVKVWAL